jgi:peptidoglycan hydrolase-like protein with peptidoglycan-binding domain
MDRLLFAKGARGPAIEKIQAALAIPAPEIDGVFGRDTEAALRRHQKKRNEPTTGEVTVSGWTALTREPVPPVFERALSLTAAFEGHGFSLAQGNFDGAGITWGIVGFTLASGSLGEVIGKIRRQCPGLLEEAFRSNEPKLRAILNMPKEKQLAWADSVSMGANKARLAEPWRRAFDWLGEQPAVRAIQATLAQRLYFDPARDTARRWGLSSELGLALCFDIHVQNGGIKPSAARVLAKRSGGTGEQSLRELIADAVAEASAPRWRENVRARKLAIARGAGAVHGEQFTLRHWGLDEIAA